ncbi:MAG TPA: hypothetical protein VKT21_02795 [Thermoplasmata archaeon]|nr:hypothetical protein [Thermoplasmata archaeon]
MTSPDPSAPGPVAALPPPLWASVALLISGAVLIIAETPNLLFFVGVGLLVIGAYTLMLRRAARTHRA